MMALFSNISSRDNILFLLVGMRITIVIAASTILVVLFFDTVLGLVRSYDHGILGKLSVVYIETFRNTPLTLRILIIRFLVPILASRSGILSISIFTITVMIGVVCGGLNSINKGQFGAAYSQGFGFFQILRFVVIPQYFKNTVPSLLSQMVTTVKGTSFLRAVAIERFTGKGMILMGRFASSTRVFILLALMAGMYSIINPTLSSIVRRQNTKGQNLKKPVPVEA